MSKPSLALLLLWALLGLAHTGMAMIRHHGWSPDRGPGSDWTVGLPDNVHAPEVMAIRRLLDEAGGLPGATILVPAPADTLERGLYLRFQLGFLEYPTPVGVEAAPAGWPPPGEDPRRDGPTILAPELAAPPGWGAPEGEVGGFRLYR